MQLKFEDEFKTCPYCKERDLQLDAIVCKHCKRDLTQSRSDNTGCITAIAVILLIAGLIFSWILVIVSILLFILAAVLKKK